MRLCRPNEAAQEAGISRQRMHQLLVAGRVIGARREAKGWLVPMPIRIMQGTQRRDEYPSNADACLYLMVQHDHFGVSAESLATEAGINLRTVYRRIAWARAHYPRVAALLRDYPA